MHAQGRKRGAALSLTASVAAGPEHPGRCGVACGAACGVAHLPSSVCRVVAPDELDLVGPHAVVDVLDAHLACAHVPAATHHTTSRHARVPGGSTGRTREGQGVMRVDGDAREGRDVAHAHLQRRPSAAMRASASSRRLPFSTPLVTSGMGMSRCARTRHTRHTTPQAWPADLWPYLSQQEHTAARGGVRATPAPRPPEQQGVECVRVEGCGGGWLQPGRS